MAGWDLDTLKAYKQSKAQPKPSNVKEIFNNAQVNYASPEPLPQPKPKNILGKIADSVDNFFKPMREYDPQQNKVFKTITAPVDKLYDIPLTQRTLVKAGEAIAGQGVMKNNDGSDMEAKNAGKVGNLVADIAGTGLGYSMPIGGLNGSLQGSANKIMKPLTDKIPVALDKAVPKLLTPLEKYYPSAASKVGTKLVDYGENALRNGLEFGALNTTQSLAQGNNIEESLGNGLEGIKQGAIFGTAIKGIGDISKSAFPKWKTTFESTAPLEIPKQEIAVTKPIIEGKFKVKNTALENAQNEYDKDVKQIQNYWGHWKLDEPEIRLGAEELGIDLDGILSRMGKAEKNGVNVKDIAERQRLAKVAGVNELPTSRLQQPLSLSKPLPEPLKLQDNTKLPIEPLTAQNEAAATIRPLELNTKAQIVSKTAKEPFTKTKAVEKANEAYIKTVDDLNRLDQFDKYYEEVTGKKLSPEQRSYYQGLNSRGADMTSRNILLENLTDREGKVVGESLKSITKDIPKDKYDDFVDYLVNKHAETRMRRGEKVYDSSLVGDEMTADKSKMIAEQYEKAHPEFKQLAQRVYDFNNKLGKTWLVDTGIISPEAWVSYLEKNPHYVPNQRLFDSLEKPMFKGSKKGFANQNNPVKKAVGSARKIIDPIESMIEHVDQYVKTAKRNETMQNVINMLKNAPEDMKDFAEIVPSKESLVDDINKVLQDEGIAGVLEKFNQPFDKSFQKQNLSGGNIVTGLVDGKKVHVKVNDVQFLDALTNLTPQAQNIVIKSLGSVTRVVKTLTTGINPVFSLTRNVFRDIPTAYVNSKSTNNPLKFSKDLVKAFVDVVKNNNDYKEYKAIGGGHSSSISSGRKALLESKNSILPGNNSPLKLAQRGIGTLERINDAIETAPRLAEYKRINKGDYGSKVKGLFEANDVTVNFNKRGEYTKSVDQIIPYFNAAVQGLDKVARTVNFKENPKAATTTLLKAFTAITIPSVMLYAINHDDPNYQQVSNSVKDANFLIPKGDGTFIKIPKPRELGVMFGSDVERALRQFADSDPKAWKDFATTIKDSFAPPTRSVLAPFSDLRANKDFANRPIVPGDLEKLSPRLQYDANTSTPAKVIGDKFNISPKKIDFLARSYGGGLAELGLPSLTPNVSLKENLKRKVTVDPVYSNDNLRDFYNSKDKLDINYSDKKHLGSKETGLEKSARTTFNNANETISKIRAQMKAVQNNINLSPEEKLKQNRDLQQKINDIANIMNKRYK